MAIAKRAAKRVSPKTLEKMRAKRLEENKRLEEIGKLRLEELRKEQEKFNREFEVTQKRKNKMREINEQGRIAQEKKERNILFKMKNKIKNKFFYKDADWSKQLYSVTLEKIDAVNSEIKKLEFEEKRMLSDFDAVGNEFKELLKNKLKTNRRKKLAKIIERSKLQFFYSLKKQDRWMSGRNLGDFREIHELAVKSLMKRYETGRLSGNDLNKYISAIESCVKELIKQNTQLQKIKSTENIDLHSRVFGKALLSFVKTGDYSEFIFRQDLIKSQIDDWRGISIGLSELEKSFR